MSRIPSCVIYSSSEAAEINRLQRHTAAVDTAQCLKTYCSSRHCTVLFTSIDLDCLTAVTRGSHGRWRYADLIMR